MRARSDMSLMSPRNGEWCGLVEVHAGSPRRRPHAVRLAGLGQHAGECQSAEQSLAVGVIIFLHENFKMAEQ